MFLEMQDELLTAEKETLAVTESFSKELMHNFDSFSLKCTSELYSFRKVNCMLQANNSLSFANKESVIKRINDLFHSEFDDDEIEETLRLHSKPVLECIDECVLEMIKTYTKYSDWLFHASAIPNLNTLFASNNKPNAYFNEMLNSVFSCSYFHETALFLLRAIAGCMYVIRSKIAIYPSNPVERIEENNLILKKPAYLYHMHVNGFIPVIDFREWNGQYHIFFCGEWHLPKDSTECIAEQFTNLPIRIFEKYKIYNYLAERDKQFEKMCKLYFSISDEAQVSALLSNNPYFYQMM